MVERALRVPVADGDVPVFTVRPDGPGPFPLALLFMDGIGFREQIRENARRFAAGGFAVAAPDLYHRSGEGVTFDMGKLAASGFQGPEAEPLHAAMALVTPTAVASDVRALLDVLRADPAVASGPWVCVGYCLGARLLPGIAAEFGADLVAAAGIHPGALVTDAPDSPHLAIPSIRAEVYFAFAEHDRTATPQVVERFRAELERHGVRGEVERVPGTSHGFAMADLAVYDADACERHFERTLELWKRALPVPA